MIIDSSALVAILKHEPETDRFVRAIVASRERSVSAPTMLETMIVLRKFGAPVTAALRELMRSAEIAIVSFGPEHLAVAEEAHRRFGRASGHPARLNFGDCFSYAAAVVANQALLYKGNDFSQTDVMPAVG